MSEASGDILLEDYPNLAYLEDDVISSYASLDDDDPRAYVHYRGCWFVVAVPEASADPDGRPDHLDQEMRATQARLRGVVGAWRDRHGYTTPITLAPVDRIYVPVDISGLHMTAEDAKKERLEHEPECIGVIFAAAMCAAVLWIVTYTIAQSID